MKNPKLIAKPFAKNGQKNVIPENYETSMESNQATWDQGFGQITMLPVAAGGLPPKGQDFNGIFNQISENIVYLSQGGRFKFSAEYAEAIGGYPKGAILQSDDEKKEYLSLIDNNKVDFNTVTDISESWKLVNTDDLLAQIASKQPKGDYATKTELNSGLAGKQPTGDYATKTEVGLKLDKTAVVQSTGASTTNVMSQKSVTDELNKKLNNTGGKITGDIILNDGTAKQDVKIRAWGAADRETVFEIDFGDEYALHVSKYKDEPVSAVFKGTVTPGDYSNFDSRYVSQKQLSDEISKLPKSTILKNNYGWFRDGATGLMMQWGKVVDQGEGKSWFDFPIPFPGACVNVQVTVNAEGVPANNYSTAYYFTLSGAEIGRDQKGAWWFAIGW